MKKLVFAILCTNLAQGMRVSKERLPNVNKIGFSNAWLEDDKHRYQLIWEDEQLRGTEWDGYLDYREPSHDRLLEEVKRRIRK